MAEEVTAAPILEDSESLESLEEKLSELKEQWDLAEEALKQDPENEELKSLKSSLLDVISLTEDLIKLKKPKPSSSVLGTRKASEVFETPAPSREVAEPEEEDENEGVEEQGEKYVIPKHLKILPDDPEDVRQRKRKKQRAIKSAFWKKKVEMERNNTTNAWKEFTSKRSKLGGSSYGSNRSIFASPSSLDGKVGVMKSEQKATPSNNYKPRAEVRKRVVLPKMRMERRRR